MNEAILPGQEAPQFPGNKDTEARLDLTCSLGFWSAVVATGIGIIYFLVIVAAALTGQMTFPPPGWLQLAGGFISFLSCPVIVAVLVSLHTIASPEKRAFSQLALSFALLFATDVTINRFVQLGVVRQSLALGETEGITWFLAYGERSIMFALEILGWGWFLGLALLFAIPVFANRGYQRWLRRMLGLYGVLALISAVAHLLDSPLTAVGFVAWGFVLYLITALLAFHFRQTALLHVGVRPITFNG